MSEPMNWDDDDWDNEEFKNAIFHLLDEVGASRNPNPTPAQLDAPAAPAPSPAPTTPGPTASAYAPVSFLRATPASASSSYLPAPSSLPPAPSFSPPPELTQHRRLALPPAAAAADGDGLATSRSGFSPPRELSQRPTIEESDCAIVELRGPAVGDRFIGTGGNVGAKREREAREVEKLKREVKNLRNQMHALKNECSKLREDKNKQDRQLKATEVEIQNRKNPNGGFAGKDVCGVGTNIDQSVHVSANGALHAASTWASTKTDKSNGKVKDARSLQEDSCLRQSHQTNFPQPLDVEDDNMIDNTTSTSGALRMEESPHLEPRSVQRKEIKMIGVQTDNTWNSDHHDYKKVFLERISSNLRVIWGRPTHSLSGRNLISKIIVSCSEEILALLQCTRLPDKPGTSSETSPSLNDAISQLYDNFVKMSNEKIPIQTFLEALVNLCSFENAAIVGRSLRILQRILQHLLNYGTESNRSVPSGTMFPWNHLRMYMWRTSIKTALLFWLRLVQKIC